MCHKNNYPLMILWKMNCGKRSRVKTFSPNRSVRPARIVLPGPVQRWRSCSTCSRSYARWRWWCSCQCWTLCSGWSVCLAWPGPSWLWPGRGASSQDCRQSPSYRDRFVGKLEIRNNKKRKRESWVGKKSFIFLFFICQPFLVIMWIDWFSVLIHFTCGRFDFKW